MKQLNMVTTKEGPVAQTLVWSLLRWPAPRVTCTRRLISPYGIGTTLISFF
jgi:hypothetical protein